MRVAAVTHSISRLGGGIPPAMKNLYDAALRLHQVDIRILGLDDAHSSADKPGWSPIPVSSYAQRSPVALGRSPKLQTELGELNADLVHTHGCWKYTSAQVFRWHRRTGRPYVVSPHGMLDRWALKNSRWKKRVAGYWFENDHLRNAACLHALNNAEAQSMREYGLANPICVIPNGVNVGDVLSESFGERVSSTVLFLGRLHPKKGLVELIRAWAQFIRVHSDWRLRIVGWDDGGHEDALRALVCTEGLNDSIEFAGPLFGDDKRRMFAGSAALILPSFSEGLPMTVLEAWEAGLPVIMTRQCNLPEGFVAGAALEVEPNVESIRDGLIRFAALDRSRCRQMGTLGRQLVQRQFTWPDIASRMLQVYRWILGDGPRPSCVRLD